MTAVQPTLPAVDDARFEAHVWRDFIDAWGELEAEYLVDPSVMVPETAFATAHVVWVVARVNGKALSCHGDNAKDAARALWFTVHGVVAR